jgi:hypothetical protein
LGILGILGIENRKPKIENWQQLPKKNLNFFFYFFIFFASVRTQVCPRGHDRVRADAPCFTPGNFKKDATVRLSHGRPRGHRPIVRPFENVRVTTMHLTILCIAWGHSYCRFINLH